MDGFNVSYLGRTRLEYADDLISEIEGATISTLPLRSDSLILYRQMNKRSSIRVSDVEQFTDTRAPVTDCRIKIGPNATI
jgi:hypothetical protein